ncbi:hypothetical protein [Congregicoccus parvus]|uniref:hypothetical protein n=1 Tax=Congregicoccus parvus TaxID=3081749 RepID=UPI003FA59CA6
MSARSKVGVLRPILADLFGESDRFVMFARAAAFGARFFPKTKKQSATKRHP